MKKTEDLVELQVVATIEGVTVIREKVSVPLKLLVHMNTSEALTILIRQKILGLIPTMGARDTVLLRTRVDALESTRKERMQAAREGA